MPPARLPFYYQLKTFALLWLTLPHFQGASYLYVNQLHPWLLAHESDIDLFLLSAKTRAKQAGFDYARRLYSAVREMILREVLGQQTQAQAVQPGDAQGQQSNVFLNFAAQLLAPAPAPALKHEPPASLRGATPPISEIASMSSPPSSASSSRNASPHASTYALGGPFEEIEEEEVIALKRSPPVTRSQAAAAPGRASPAGQQQPARANPAYRRNSFSQINGNSRGSWFFWSGQAKGESQSRTHPKQE